MKIVIPMKQSNTGSIHDTASDTHDRVIAGRGKYAVVIAAYYGGCKGYTTHMTADAAVRQYRLLAAKGYSVAVISETGSYAVDNNRLIAG